jgi:hypothetical protein
MNIKHYYKKKITNKNITVEYNSEDDEINIEYEHKLNNGASIGTDYLRIHPSYVKPLIEALQRVTKVEDEK